MNEKLVDARGKACPMPIVMIAKAMRTSDAGDVLMVMADDRAFPEDVRAWCVKTKNELLGLEHNQGHYEARIKKS